MSTEEVPQPLALDPFAFHGHPASVIAGLGGPEPGPDPTYAFHTHYVPVQRGRAHFIVRFKNLQARRGTLWLRIHMMPSQPGAVARLVTGERVQLNRLVQIGGSMTLRFEAFRGATYAIMGLITDDTDAAADDLAILIDKPADHTDTEEVTAIDEARETDFGTQQVKTSNQIVSLDPPSLATPVSQPCTKPQLREKALGQWAARLSMSEINAATWQFAYVLQVLSRYGMMQPGARGLCIGETAANIISVVSDEGLMITRVGLEEEGQEQPLDPDSLRMSALDLPGSLAGFDFLWSIRATDMLDESGSQRMIEAGMECLRPGGVAVHVVGYEPSLLNVPPSANGIFNRGGIERLGVSLISRGHDLARIKPALQATLSAAEGASGSVAVPFGIIARRARSIL